MHDPNDITYLFSLSCESHFWSLYCQNPRVKFPMSSFYYRCLFALAPSKSCMHNRLIYEPIFMNLYDNFEVHSYYPEL